MSLVPVDLPSPEQMRFRWAAASAILAALGFEDGATVTGSRWHYDDGGGNRCDLALLPDGRTVLFGHDHECSETYFRSAAAYFEETPTDLVAGAPDWWPTVLPDDAEDVWIGFVYGWDQEWSRAPYDLEDGFTSVGLPTTSEEKLLDLARDFVEGAAQDQDLDLILDSAVVRALGAAGPELTVDHLRAVFGPVNAGLDAGVRAARRFT